MMIMLAIVNKFERFVYAALIPLLVVLGFSIVELCWLLISSLTNPHPLPA